MSEIYYPVGIQDFESLRRLNAVYVDKTALVYKLTHTSKYVFLSRPRRFGKSLLCSTMKYYFEGRRELFEGLAMAEFEKEWTEYPVLYFSLSRAKNYPVEQLSNRLRELIAPYEEIYGPCTTELPGARLEELIHKAYKQTGKSVVIILDEYDAPLLDVLHEDDALTEVRRIMQEFYTPLKDADPYLRFCFITGITKFSQLSIFSTINNLENISMIDEYASLCGITESEFHAYFEQGIEDFARSWEISASEAAKQLKAQYDGYHFSKRAEDTYNPFSLLNALKQKEVDNYWFSSGTPSFLLRQMKHFKTDFTKLDGMVVSSDSFNQPTENMHDALPLLYQSGYLTIKGYERHSMLYTLGLPNAEVQAGLMRNLLPYYYTNLSQQETISFSQAFGGAILQDQPEKALELLRSFLASIPYPEGGKEVLQDMEKAEYYYEQLLYVIFSMFNKNVRTQVRSCRGRADMVMETFTSVYVFELKMNRPASEALAQIDEKGYMLPYETDGRKLVKVGISFSTETRTIEEWKIG